MTGEGEPCGLRGSMLWWRLVVCGAVTLTRRVAADQLMREGWVLDGGPLSELPLPSCQRAEPRGGTRQSQIGCRGGGGGGDTEVGGRSRAEPGEAAGGRQTTTGC